MATETMTSTANRPAHYRDALERDGFVVIRSLLPPDKVKSLREAATNATALTRSGQWPFFRTVPKQFPPWPKNVPPASEGGIWGCQHLLHPDMPWREQFAQVYFDEKVLEVVEELLGVSAKDDSNDEPLVMELFNMLVAPVMKEFELRWHRDDVPDTAAPEEELRMLQSKSPGGRQSHAQYNIALCPDNSLIAVPGSHRRIRSEAERQADPFEAEMPGQTTVSLQPGDAVFYDSNILHRGVYRPKPEGGEETRLTLHGSVGLKVLGCDNDGKVRATAVLQHGVGSWVSRDDAALGAGQRAENMRRNLIAMGSGEGVGYSLEG